MIPCPSCQQPIEILEKHLGTLYTCPHCNSVYFIDWNGQPELAQHEPQESIEEYSPPPPPIEEPYSADYSAPASQELFQPAAEVAEEGQEVQGFEVSEQIYATETEEPGIPETPPVQEASEFSSQPESEEVPYDFSQTLDAVNVDPVIEPTTGIDSPDFSDVSDFGNSTDIAGPLSYTLTIEGLESSLLLSQLEEAMTDSRFAWDVPELLATIDTGRLVITGLSPVKASVLISRIKYLPFKISWRQDVLGGS